VKERGLLPHFNQGFTLIELIVAVAIGAVLIAGGMAAYKGVGEKQNLKQAGLEFKTNLTSTQKKALSGEKPSGCTGSLESFEVDYVSESEYSVQANCSVFSPEAEGVSLPEEVSFSAPFSTITFPVLSAGLSGGQTIVISSDSFSYQVVVEPSGVIEGDFYEE